MDPYKVLGVLPHSSEADIQKAYEELIKTYNTDDLQDASVKTFYKEKLHEANEAYRIISHNIACEEVRELIELDDFITAESKLNLVADLSSAEWHYLKGVLLLKKGWIDSGVSHIKKAASLNPYNSEYISAANRVSQSIRNYKSNFNHHAPQNQGANGINLCGGNNGGGKQGLC